MIGELGDFVKESKIIDELMSRKNKLIMIIGGSDTGKTTLVERIAGDLAKHSRIAIVDTDMGQSHIGPPTTIAWGKCEGGFKGWSRIIAEDFYFTGTVTPFGSLLPAVVGTRLMTDRAVSSCEKVLIDTTGLIAEPAGRVLKQFKVDIIAPDIIIALERSEELDHILDAFRSHRRPTIHRLPVPPKVETKSTVKRSRYRFEKIMAYFKDSGVIEAPLEAAGVRFTGELLKATTALKNRIVSFRDDRNRDIALGIIEKVILRESSLLIRTPLREGTAFSAVVIGKAEIDTGASELRDRSIRKRKG